MESNLYSTLGVSQNASDNEIKKAYRSLSLKYHPDRNRSHEAEQIIRNINDAYGVLGDPSKRKQYDLELKLGVRHGDLPGGMPPPMSELFEMFFQKGMGEGGSSPFSVFSEDDMPEIHIFSGLGGGGASPFGLGNAFKSPIFKQFQEGLFNAPKPISKTLTISYEQAYHGCQLPIEIERETYIGDMIINEEETLYVSILPGIDENEIITLKGKGNINKKQKKGDVKVSIKLESNPLFSRNGLDLIYHKQVSLKEALCGFQFEIPHLNGKMLALNNIKNRAIIRPRFRKIVPNLGFEREQSKGSLIIEFDVVFPEQLSEEQIQIIEKVL